MQYKMFFNTMSFIVIFGQIVADDVSIPQWDEIVGPLKEAAKSFVVYLDTDSALYKSLNSTLMDVIKTLEDITPSRDKSFDCVVEGFKNLKKDLAASKEKKGTLQKNFAKERQLLLGKLDALKLSADAEIATLKNKLDAAGKKLILLQKQKKSVEGEHSEMAQEVMTIFRDVARKYDVMINEKTTFINLIENLSNKIEQELKTAHVEGRQFKNDTGI